MLPVRVLLQAAVLEKRPELYSRDWTHEEALERHVRSSNRSLRRDSYPWYGCGAQQTRCGQLSEGISAQDTGKVSYLAHPDKAHAMLL